MKNRLVFAPLLVLLATQAFAAQSDDPLHLLQMLGGQIKAASEHAKAGKQPESEAMKKFEHTLVRLRAAVGDDAQLQRKYQAVSLLFGNLKHQAAHPISPANADNRNRANIDLEVVADQHGANCANALGISEKLPVSLTLGQAGTGRSDAWFRFVPHASGNVRFITDSTGPDPALEVFNGCAANAEKMAGNDDALGLDAAVSVSATKGKAVFVHLTNSGQGGRMLVSVADATSTVNGTVKDLKTGLPIENASVSLFNSGGFYTGFDANTDSNGNYSIVLDAPDDYYVRANPPYSQSYISELYPAGICFPQSYDISNCDLAHASLLNVTSGTTIPNINFMLNPGQRISGQLRDTSNNPVSGGQVLLFDDSGNELEGTSPDSFGRYALSALPPGSYKVEGQANGYGSAMFNQVACGGPLQTACDLNQAATLVVSNQDITGVDFKLPQLASIRGIVIDKNSQQPLPYARVHVLNAQGQEINWTYTSSFDASYTIGPFAIGSYYVYADSAGYFSQIFDAIDCPSDCLQEISNATALSIATTGQQVQADFHLVALPDVRGHVQDAASGLPLANVSILVSVLPPATFQTINSTTSDVNGDYVLSGTPQGTYYVWAISSDHIDQIYSDIACEASYNYPAAICDVTGATLLTIALGQTPGTFDFALNASSSIGGRASIRGDVGSDFAAVAQVSIYDTAGSLVGQAGTDALGNYLVNDLVPGTYFAAANGNYYTGYVEQLWQQIDCTSPCAPTTGTPILVGATSSIGGIDFQMIRLDAVVGRVTNSLGDPVGGAIVDLFNSADDSYQASGVADTQGYYLAEASMGYSYYVATEAGFGYVDQLYSGISCPLGPAYFGVCPFTNATPVSLSSFDTQPHIVDFVLQSNDPIFANGFE